MHNMYDVTLPNVYDQRMLDKPSYPNHIYKKLQTILKEYDKRANVLKSEFSWIEDKTTSISCTSGQVRFDSDSGKHVSFHGIHLGTYDTSAGIWKWSWVGEDGSLMVSNDALYFNNYGHQKHLGILTKSRWYATNQDIDELVAICTIIKKGRAVFTTKNLHCVEYFLLMDVV